MLEIKKPSLLGIGIMFQSFSFVMGKYASIYESYTLFFLSLSFLFMGLRAYFWQKVLKYNELSRVYPLNSLVLVLILVYSVLLFEENINIYNILGLSCMVFGAFMLGKSK